MKHAGLKPLALKLATVFLFISAALIIHSCKKENNSNKEPVVNDPTVSAAKTWYQSTYPVSAVPVGKFTTQSVGSSPVVVFNYSKFINPDWQHAASYTRDKTGVIELPIDPASVKIGSAFRNAVAGKVLYQQKYSRSSFLLLKDSIQYQAYIMTIIADSAYLKNDLSKLALNTYRKRDTDFSGVVVYFTPTGKFVSSYGYKNGQLIPAPSAGQSTSGQSIQSVNDPRLKTDEVAACEDWYLDTYENDELVSSVYLYTICGGDGSEAGGTSPPPPPPPCSTPSQNDDAVHFVTNVAAPPDNGGGAGGGFPPPTTTTSPCEVAATITDNVTNPCLHSMVQSTISENVTNQINTLIQSIFGESTTMNITFVDVNNLPPNVDAGTPLPTAGVVNGTLNVTIQLDNTHLPSYSQQYIARVIMHETLHAYIAATSGTANTTNVLQHESMMQNYVVKMATSLQQMFPGLSNYDAQNLALGGLQDADTFKTTIETNLGLLGSFEATNFAYSTGGLGYRCN